MNIFPIDRIIINSGFNIALENEIIVLANYKNINISSLSIGLLELGDVQFYFLNQKNSDDENEESLVIYTKINNKHILLMGDAGFPSKNYFLNEYNLPKMDIL